MLQTARQATVQICDQEGRHRGQGLLLDLGDGGPFVLTCHHVVASLLLDDLRVRIPDGSGRLGQPIRCEYVEHLSKPRRDAVVLRIDGSVGGKHRAPTLYQLDPATFEGPLWATCIGYTERGLGLTFNGKVAAGQPLVHRGASPGTSTAQGYEIPYVFRLTEASDASEGISGSVVWCDGGIVGLVHFARAESDRRGRQGYVVPLDVWAEGWDALGALLKPLAGELEKLILPIEEVYERLRIDDFVGRDWLDCELDHFLNDPEHDRGVWLLVGSAGTGKTAFLAHQVRQHPDYVYFFAEQAPGDGNLREAVLSLAAQLVLRYHLADRDPSEWESTPGLLSRLLRSAAAKLDDGERLVMVLDGLDEAGRPDDGNVLGIPETLPRGVYLIASQRPKPIALTVEPMPCRIDLLEEDPKNQDDVAVYLRTVGADRGLGGRLQTMEHTVDDFVRILTEKSAGNWMYLHYVVDELRRGQREALDLHSLPAGLTEYYARYWRRWRERGAAWDDLYAPLLSTMAAALEELDLPTLKRWAGVHADLDTIYRLLHEEWAAFIFELGGQEPRYRPRHASLRDFLAGEPEAKPLAPGSQGLLDELKRRALRTHARVGQSLSDSCGGNWGRLLTDPGSNAFLAAYAHRHLSTHLRKANDVGMLLALVNDRDWCRGQLQMDPGGMAYRNDMQQAWEAAEQVNREASAHNTPAPYLALEVRCALLVASLNALEANIPPELILSMGKALSSDGGEGGSPPAHWSPHAALATAQRLSHLETRVDALIAVIPHLSGALRDEVAYQTLQETMAIGDHPQRVQAQGALLPYLPMEVKEAVLRQALTALLHVPSVPHRAWALAAIAGHLPDEVKDEWVQATVEQAESVQARGAAAEALTPLMSYLAAPQRDALLRRAVKGVRWIGSRYRGATARAILSSYLPQREKERQLGLALAALGTSGEQSWGLPESGATAAARAKALVTVVPYLPDTWMKGALKSARSNPHRYWRARAVAAVADRLPKPVAGDTLRRALMDARPVADEYQRRAALVTLLPGLMRARCVGTAGAAARAIAKERSKQLLLFLACVGIVVGVIAGWLWLYNVMHVEVFSLGLLILLVIAAAGAVLLLLDLIGAVTLIAWARNRLHRLPPLPEPAEKGPLVEALGSALTIQDDGLRAKALSRVAKPLAMQEPAWLYPVWCETLHLSARRNRPGLLKDLCALRPVMRVLGGVGAIDALARAILDVGHQWP